MSQFTKITSGSSAFAQAVKTFDSLVDRFDYDGMAKAYNELAVSEIMQFEYKRGKSSVVRQQLEKRGLSSGQDFQVRSAGIEGNEENALVLIRRDSDKAAGAVVHAQRGRKSAASKAATADAAAPAADAGTAAPAADASAKADAKGAKGK